MPDISMCLTHTCKSKFKCYRYMAEASEFNQSYSLFDPGGDDRCDYFFPIEKAPTKLRGSNESTGTGSRDDC